MGWWRWALVSPDGVAPSRMVGVSASVNLLLHHKIQKFSSGTSSSGLPRKKGRKMVVVVVWCYFVLFMLYLLYTPCFKNAIYCLGAYFITYLWCHVVVFFWNIRTSNLMQKVTVFAWYFMHGSRISLTASMPLADWYYRSTCIPSQSPIPVLNGLNIEQRRLCNQRPCHYAKPSGGGLHFLSALLFRQCNSLFLLIVLPSTDDRFTAVLWFVVSREIADGLAAIDQLASEKSQLENDIRACREEYNKLCQDNSRLVEELDSSRKEYTTVTSELDVCIASVWHFVPLSFWWTSAIRNCAYHGLTPLPSLVKKMASCFMGGRLISPYCILEIFLLTNLTK